MDERAIQVLELPAVLAKLAAQTSFSASREAALALRPVTDLETVVRRQRETAEAVHLDVVGVDVPLGGAHDVRPVARAAERGHVLAPTDMLDVASLVRAAQRVQRVFIRTAEDTPLLSTIAAGIADLAPLRDLVEQSLSDRGEVLDDASPELRTIRREITAAHDRLQQRINALIASASIRPALQEPIVTIRDGRYVIPVRAEARGAVPGVVHDTSASGATVYVEPMAVVDLGNRWRELQVQERHEVERILREISAAIGEAADDLVDAVEHLAHLDLAMAKAKLARALGARDLASTGPRVPWVVGAPAELRLVEARHPLLEGDVVPVTLHVGGDFRALLITGPNTGGKTVALKTAGLLCLMALAGLPIPADRGSQVPVYDAVFADIGDEQSIEQSLSTFSGHMTAIIDILERASDRSLVLLDELGAGTDPTEGAALAVSIVDRLVGKGVALVATTHHSELKLYAHRTAEVMNASVEFDVETLSPTYRLTIGLPGMSNALAIATRLGMPADVIERAREGLSDEERDVESLLADLRTQLASAEERAIRAARDAAEAAALRADLERRLAELESSQARIVEETRARVAREMRDVERLIERARREVEAARLQQARADFQLAREEAARAMPETPRVERPRRRHGVPVEVHDVHPGTEVWLQGVASPGEALSGPDERGEFDVQLGALRMRVRLEQVEQAGPPGSTGASDRRRSQTMTLPAPPPAVSEEIEVRGRRVDEALPEVEAYLDAAARSGRDHVRLIHGKGTGTLRRAVRDLLEQHPLVTSFESAPPREGGDGVTIAHLAG